MNQIPRETFAAAGMAWGFRTYENERLPRDQWSAATDPLIDALSAAMDPELGDERLVVAGPFEREVIGRVCEWLEGRTGYEGGGFTSADDVRQAILKHFGGQS